MARLIDADKLMTDYGMSSECKDCKRESKCDSLLLMWRDVCEMLDDAPTVDAVQVVRCKDCKHRECVHDPVSGEIRNDMFFCKNIYYSSRFDFYCADGERKDGDYYDKGRGV